MTKLILILLFNICFLSPTMARTLYLQIGETQKWPLPPTDFIHVGHKDILHVVDKGKNLQMTAKKLGRTTVEFQGDILTVVVLHKRIYKLFTDLKFILENTQGLQLSEDIESCNITGELLSLQDWLKIYNVQRNYSSFCRFQAKIHPLIRQNVYDFWKQKIHHEQLQELKLNLETYFEISSYQLNEKDYERLNKKIAPWGLTIHQRENIKQRPALVQVKLLLAEVSKNHNQNYGFDWSQNYQANLLPGKDILGSWLVKLNALESAGEGQVLAAPTLVAESGGQAEFLAGGEFPIRVKAFSSSKVEWKKHGLLFKIYPVVDASSRVFLKIESEVSMIDSANSVEGIPGLKVSRLNSQFNLKNGETVALSGLIQQRMAEGNSGISFIKNIPVLGALFKSQNFQNEKSELVVFVQPLVVEQNQNVDFPQYELLNEHYRTY